VSPPPVSGAVEPSGIGVVPLLPLPLSLLQASSDASAPPARRVAEANVKMKRPLFMKLSVLGLRTTYQTNGAIANPVALADARKLRFRRLDGSISFS
jgi:hypothetical protein